MDLTGMLQAAAGQAGGENLYIEDVFSTYLYTGNGSTQTITNGIDLDGEGGLVWIKMRATAGYEHILTDTARGAQRYLSSDNTLGQQTGTNDLTAFTSTGFSLGISSRVNRSVASENTFASWTFRKAPKFFDCVTWTGTGSARTVSHNLGSVPGCIIVKRTNTSGDWQVYHRANTANPETDYLVLNTTAATADSDTRWNDTLPTDAVFSLGTEATVNASGGTYVAYLFAHDAGGFGDDGEQNVVSCGSFTLSSGSATVTLGYEPQFVIFKPTSTTGDWLQVDTMRGGFDYSAFRNYLRPNLSAAEDTFAEFQGAPTSTGFTLANLGGSSTYIYIAIRRGPMKTPTAGTEVFNTSYFGQTSGYGGYLGAPVDMFLRRSGVSVSGQDFQNSSRLTSRLLFTNLTNAEDATNTATWLDNMKGVFTSTGTNTDQYFWMFRRAPGFMDVVCYTGTGSAKTEAHNLGVVPELMFVKNRSDATGRAWAVYAGDNTDYLVLNTTAATADDNTYWNDTSPTTSVFTVGTNNSTNESGDTFVAYLFASLAGVSKIGTYTGNGTSVTVTTGFQPRFILVKRTDSTGNWLLGDSARGLVAGDDPFLVVNTADAQVTDQDWVDISATGFTVNETAANANVSTATYIYLAIS